LAVVSEAKEPMQVTIHFPQDSALPLPKSFWVMDGKSPEHTNEFSEEVRVVRKSMHINGHTLSIQLPAWGLGVMLTDEGAL
jgi:predicted alpha-1,6-mannanase (GH76 family)